MKQEQNKGPEAPIKNPLSEKIKDISKLIVPRGNVLLELIQINSALSKSNIIIPDTVDQSELGLTYYVVYKTGNDSFKETHPEFVDESQTKVGNVVIILKPSGVNILTNKGREFIQVHESLIVSQVTPDNFTK